MTSTYFVLFLIVFLSRPGYGHRFTDGDAYIDVITWLYDRLLLFRARTFVAFPSCVVFRNGCPCVQSTAMLCFCGQLQRDDCGNLCCCTQILLGSRNLLSEHSSANLASAIQNKTSVGPVQYVLILPDIAASSCTILALLLHSSPAQILVSPESTRSILYFQGVARI